MEVKNENPVKHLTGKKVHKLVEAYFELNHLKQLYRQGWLTHSDMAKEKCESVADHSFATALTAYFIADEFFPELNVDKVLKLALIHDLGEVYAGDITPYMGVSKQEKTAKERNAVREIFSKLSKGKEYLELWEEHEANSTPEAKFVKQVDGLEMALQASVYHHQGIKVRETFYEKAREKVSDPKLVKILDELGLPR